MLTDSLIEDFASLVPYDYLPKDYNIWYVGIENTIDRGIQDLLINLKKRGHILIGDPEIIDYVWSILSSELIYVIFYKSLSKLEYLEYKWHEKEDNNGHLSLSR
jgi:hypothetical protein